MKRELKLPFPPGPGIAVFCNRADPDEEGTETPPVVIYLDICYNDTVKGMRDETWRDDKKTEEGGWHITGHGSEHDLWSNEDLRSLPYISLPRHWNRELSRKVEGDFLRAMREVERNRKEKKDD